MPPRVARSVSREANLAIWDALGYELPQPDDRPPRDPYWEQGCHPDIVGRLWDDLGRDLPDSARAQARGRPVLAHAGNDRVIAFARGTAYAMWVAPEDRPAAEAAGASSVWRWGSGATSDLAELGAGWIWGRWYTGESTWLRHAYAAAQA